MPKSTHPDSDCCTYVEIIMHFSCNICLEKCVSTNLVVVTGDGETCGVDVVQIDFGNDTWDVLKLPVDCCGLGTLCMGILHHGSPMGRGWNRLSEHHHLVGS